MLYKSQRHMKKDIQFWLDLINRLQHMQCMYLTQCNQYNLLNMQHINNHLILNPFYIPLCIIIFNLRITLRTFFDTLIAHTCAWLNWSIIIKRTTLNTSNLFNWNKVSSTINASAINICNNWTILYIKTICT